jgi:hypothetical protein
MCYFSNDGILDYDEEKSNQIKKKIERIFIGGGVKCSKTAALPTLNLQYLKK